MKPSRRRAAPIHAQTQILLPFFTADRVLKSGHLCCGDPWQWQMPVCCHEQTSMCFQEQESPSEGKEKDHCCWLVTPIPPIPPQVKHGSGTSLKPTSQDHFVPPHIDALWVQVPHPLRRAPELA